MSEELRAALESVKGYRMSQEELDAQRISFVFGNAPSEEESTKESVHRAVDLAEIANRVLDAPVFGSSLERGILGEVVRV